MRKQTKLVAVLSAAALVALGASMTSMAATGWTQEDGLWYYYNANGDYVTDEWKRSGDNYFYLGWDGYMLTNQLVQHGDNYYYVDANGAMVKNQWIAVATDEDSAVDHRWYYFGSTGRAYRNSTGFSKKTINGKKYAFDDEGKMLYGWVDGDGMELNDDENAPLSAVYFFGPNDTTTIDGVTYTGGAMVTGWYEYLEGIDQYEDEGKDVLWFYFNTSTGKKTGYDGATTKRINGLYYSFDDQGVMNSGWQIASGSNASESQYYSGSDQGWRQRNTWIWAVPSEDQNAEDHENDTYRWFYAGADGKVVNDQAKRINSKWYIFNEVGIMKTGLMTLVDSKDDSAEDAISSRSKIDDTFNLDELTADELKKESGSFFYFGNDEENDGSMKTGSNVQITLADGTYTFGFAKNGKAFHGVENKRLYWNGMLQTGGDMRYSVAKNPVNDKYYVVGPTGTFASDGSTVKDADDNYYAVVGGHIFYVPADDSASRVAKAIVALGEGKLTSLYVWDDKEDEYVKATKENVPAKGEDCQYFVRVSDDYVRVSAESYWTSHYTKAWNTTYVDADMISSICNDD